MLAIKTLHEPRARIVCLTLRAARCAAGERAGDGVPQPPGDHAAGGARLNASSENTAQPQR